MAPRLSNCSSNHCSATRPFRTTAALAATVLVAAILLLGGSSTPAAALDDLSPMAVERTQGDACPALTAIKYPWLSCRANEYGGTTLVLPSQPAPLKCHMRLRNGECAASPRPWWPVRP